MFVLIEYPISDPGYFKAQKPLYSVLCELINLELSKRGLTGHSDPSVFSATRLMRMPNTINRKPMKGDKKAYVIRKTIEGQGWELRKIGKSARRIRINDQKGVQAVPTS